MKRFLSLKKIGVPNGILKKNYLWNQMKGLWKTLCDQEVQEGSQSTSMVMVTQCPNKCSKKLEVQDKLFCIKGINILKDVWKS